MKKLLIPLLLSLGFIGNASASSPYKCTAEQAYGVTEKGILQNDVKISPNWYLDVARDMNDNNFVIDRETGRFLGGGFPIKGDGETFTIVSQGNKNTEFKAYFAEPWSGWMISINIIEHRDSFKKPFVYFHSPNPTVITGTCVNY